MYVIVLKTKRKKETNLTSFHNFSLKVILNVNIDMHCLTYKTLCQRNDQQLSILFRVFVMLLIFCYEELREWKMQSKKELIIHQGT